jgi:hypothetical protein
MVSLLHVKGPSNKVCMMRAAISLRPATSSVITTYGEIDCMLLAVHNPVSACLIYNASAMLERFQYASLLSYEMRLVLLGIKCILVPFPPSDKRSLKL